MDLKALFVRTMQSEDAGPRGLSPSAWTGNSDDPTSLARPGQRERRSGAGVAWLILLCAAVHPPHGWGVALCPSRWLNGLPCPGCGLSRSVSCAIRGMWLESWSYHPFGILVAGMLVAVAAFSVLPRGVRDRIHEIARPIASIMRGALALFVAAFVCFGVWRMLAELG